MFINRTTSVSSSINKILVIGRLVTLCWLAVIPLSTAEMRLLSDTELDQTTAQAAFGPVPFSINAYRDNIQLHSLERSNQILAERILYFSEIEQSTTFNRAQIEQDIEAALITLSAQIASTAALTSLFPIIGLPLGVGISSAPNTFEVRMSDVSVEADITIEIRE